MVPEYKSYRNYFKKEFAFSATIGLSIILACNIAGYIWPPFSLLSMPIYLTVVIAFVNYKLYDISFTATVIYNYSLLLLNDVVLRLLLGIHDSEDRSWIALFFTLTFIIVTIIMIVQSVNGKGPDSKRIPANEHYLTVLSSALISGIIYYFVISNVGYSVG